MLTGFVAGPTLQVYARPQATQPNTHDGSPCLTWSFPQMIIRIWPSFHANLSLFTLVLLSGSKCYYGQIFSVT